ncbi:17095_t:CDS:2 [Cetraspora pellucida]|uniref:17095_t:CDS:1 n=1 Tax=Cetraspora pellucida TaxID=1433469 RepID=A0A9N8VQ00_9GLOM|nr:17095_t:CDS:2 [Cetraspora pellucida]
MTLENTNAEDFDDAVKVEIIKDKMARKYAPVPPQNNFINPAVNIDKRFQPFDNPDTYEARIRLLLLGVANDNAQVLRTLKTHLSGDQKLYSWMRNENIAAKQNVSIISQSIVSQPVFPSYDEMQKSFQAILEKQKAESKVKIEKLKTEFELKMSQQSKKSYPSVPPKDYKQIHKFYTDQGDPRWLNLFKEEALQ